MDVRVGKIVGRLGDGVWGQVHEFEPEDERRKRERGKLVAVVGVTVEMGEGEVGVVSTGREILSRLHELYYMGQEGGVLESLRRAVEQVEEEFGGGEIGAVALVDGAVYVAASTGIGVWVRKKSGNEGWLVNPVQEGSGKTLSFSGWGEEGMVLVAGNSRFWERLPMGVVKAALVNSGGKVEEAVETLAAVEHGSERGGGEVGAIIQITAVTAEESSVPFAEEPEAEEPEAGETGAAEIHRPETADREELKRREEPRKRNWGKVLAEIAEKVRPRRQVFVVHQDRSILQKRARYAGLVFLAATAVFFGIGRVRGRMMAQKVSQEEQIIETVRLKYDEAKSLAGLNPVRSRQLLSEVRAELEKLPAEGKARKDERIVRIEAEFGEVLGTASGVKEAAAAEVVNLGLVREGLEGQRMAKGEDNELWVAGNEGRVVRVNASRGGGKVELGKEQTGEASLLAWYPGRLAVISDKGMTECQLPITSCKLQIEKDQEWGEIADMEIWAGNVYLMDSGKGQIWKYSAGEGGYGGRKGWISEESQGQSLRNMTIDGSIWVLTKAGGQGSGGTEVVKYTQGVREEWAMTGLDRAFGEEAVIYTDEESEKIYVLDRVNRRVVAADKATGGYESQWVSEKMGEATDMVADEEEGKIYLLGGRYVWSVEM